MATKKTKLKSELIGVRVSKDTKKILSKRAEKEDRSISWLVSKIIDDYLKKS